METVWVTTTRLKKEVEKNRKNHRSLYEQAMDVYRNRMIEHLEKMLKDALNGKKVEHSIRMPLPEDHTADYDRVLKMLEMSTEKEVEISQRDFARYVMDQWEWRETFRANSLSYLADDPGYQ